MEMNKARGDITALKDGGGGERSDPVTASRAPSKSISEEGVPAGVREVKRTNLEAC